MSIVLAAVQAEKKLAVRLWGAMELASRQGISQSRVTQILNLTYLAPDIQAEILGLEAIDGIEPMSERPLRLVLAEVV